MSLIGESRPYRPILLTTADLPSSDISHVEGFERHVEAAAMWNRYLELDDSSPWAGARATCAKDCEMQLARL